MTTAPPPVGAEVPYLEPNQSRSAPPTEFENQLGDAIESAYAAGVHDLEGLVGRLNADGPPPRDGGQWTTEQFTILMAELGR